MAERLLIVEDHAESRLALTRTFEREKMEVIATETIKAGLNAAANQGPFDLVLTDLSLPDGTGQSIVEEVSKSADAPPVIVLTAHGTVEKAVEAMQAGAFHFLQKPINLDELRVQVSRALAHSRLQRENTELKKQIDQHYGFDGIVGETKGITEILGKVRQVAPTKAPVMILGESGTGKELLARAIHQNSPRVNKPFIPVHCAALAETLLESELFGHEKGAFTGAHQRHIGRFESAQGGTVFLDEIGEIPLTMQVKLLRVLESYEVQRVGGNDIVPVDFRLVAATNRDLQEEVAEGRFREDLYYRLAVVSLTLPPLRQRQGDIALLTDKFTREFAKEHGKPVPKLNPAVMNRLLSHHWPGNIRELRNCLENMVIFSDEGVIEEKDLPPNLREVSDEPSEGGSIFNPGMTLDQMEQEAIRQTLSLAGGNRTRAAEMLGISRRTLQRKIKDLGIDAG